GHLHGQQPADLVFGQVQDGHRYTRAVGTRTTPVWYQRRRTPVNGIADSLAEPLRMRPVPIPRSPDDILQVQKSGLPAKLLHRLARGGHQLGRIAGAARAFADWNRKASNSLHRPDHIADAVPAAGPQVEYPKPPGFGSLQGQGVGHGQILDVDVVPDAGAVGR